MGAGSSLAEGPSTYSRTGIASSTRSSSSTKSRSARTSESNIVENAVPGVRLTLKGITSSPASITTTAAAIDKDAVAKKVQALVDAYNTIVTSVRSELSEKSVPTARHDRRPAEGQAVRGPRA